MEAQHMPVGEPQVRRLPKPNPRDPAAVVQHQGPQVVKNQQPRPRKANRAELQQQPAQGFEDPQYYDDVQRNDSAGLQVKGFEGSGYSVAKADGQGYYGCDVAQVEYAPTGHGYDSGNGQDQELGRVRPTQTSKNIKRKNPNSQLVAKGANPGYDYDQQGGYGNQEQWSGYDQQAPARYKAGFGNQHEVEGYNQPEQGNFSDGGYIDPIAGRQQPNRENSGRSEGTGSARSRITQDGNLHGSSNSSDREPSGSGRARDRAINRVADQRHPTGSSRSGLSVASNSGSIRSQSDSRELPKSKENERKPPKSGLRSSAGGGIHLTADVLRALDNKQPTSAPLNFTTNDHTPGDALDFSMIVNPGEKRDLETQIFGNQQNLNPPARRNGPLYPRTGEHPHPNQRRFPENHHRPPPAPQQAPQQAPHYPTPKHRPTDPQQTPSIYNPNQVLVEYDTDLKPESEPNAKCIACVHNIAVPIARLGTRILCRQCTALCTCTIL